MLIDSINNKTTIAQSKGTILNLKSKIKYLHNENIGWLENNKSRTVCYINIKCLFFNQNSNKCPQNDYLKTYFTFSRNGT